MCCVMESEPMVDFESFCLQALGSLGSNVAQELADGQVSLISGVETQLMCNDVDDVAQLYCQIGTPYPNTELLVYRQLLELQLIFSDTIDAMFVRDSLNDRLLFTARLPLSDSVSPSDFCQAVTGLIEQVLRWRQGLLTGLIMELPEFTGHPMADAAESAMLG